MSRKIPDVCSTPITSGKITSRSFLDQLILYTYILRYALLLFIHTFWISTILILSHERHNLVSLIWHGHVNIVPGVSFINILFCPAIVYFPLVCFSQNISNQFTYHFPCQKRQTSLVIALYFSNKHIIAFSHVTPSYLWAFIFFLFLIHLIIFCL